MGNLCRIRHLGSVNITHVLKDGRKIKNIDGYIISAENNEILYKQLDYVLCK